MFLHNPTATPPFSKSIYVDFNSVRGGGAFFQYENQPCLLQYIAGVKKIRDLLDFRVYLLMLIQCHARKKDGAT